MMLELLGKNSCTGCGACVNACPSNHIHMIADCHGFLYPVSNNKYKCLDCKQCAQSCPVLKNSDASILHKEPNVYAAWSLDDKVRLSGSSGGVFTELAKQILRQSGYVIGAAFNKSRTVEHVLIDDQKDIPLLCQSKYMQSETKDIYKQAAAALQTKKPVLFVGTPCQCAGLHSFLHAEYENLILCDFICHGVNSPMVYRKYVKELEDKYGAALTSITFRDKSCGWNKSSIKAAFNNGKEYLCSHKDDPFMYGFLRKGLNLYQRPSCGECAFKGIKRPVDITMGDFWGIDLPDHNNKEKGVSAIITHSEKGEALFGSIGKSVFTQSRSIEELVRNNPSLMNSAVTRDTTGIFYNEIQKTKFSEAVWNTEMKIQEQEGENG